MSSGVGVPRVDPRPKGAVNRAIVRVLRTRVGRWFGINVAARVDPYLLKVTRGYFAFGGILPTANVTTIGAKSGAPRTAPLVYFNDGDDVILIASSFGRDTNPAWYYNLKAHPQATLTRFGRSGEYTATEVEDDGERARLFAIADVVFPGYADYRVRTAAVGRRIPIMRLELLTGG
jgi:deazaflavin-dependent oxidoreductase (nitroreductase family)